MCCLHETRGITQETVLGHAREDTRTHGNVKFKSVIVHVYTLFTCSATYYVRTYIERTLFQLPAFSMLRASKSYKIYTQYMHTGACLHLLLTQTHTASYLYFQ